MEFRQDLLVVLLSGLPTAEQHEVLDIIDQTTGAALYRKRHAEGSRSARSGDRATDRPAGAAGVEGALRASR